MTAVPNNSFSAQGQDQGFESPVGVLLRQTREQYQLELEDVSNYLNIRKAQLEAIEQGRFDTLPGTAYAIGFIKSYANYLGLNSAAVVEEFKREKGMYIEKTDVDVPIPASESRIPDQKIIIGSVAAFFVFVLLLVWGFSGDDEQEVVQTDIPTVESVMGTQVIEQGASEPVMESVTIIEQEVMEDALPEVSVQPAMSADEQTAPQVSDNSLQSTGRATVYGAMNTDSKFAIKARQASWVQIKDGQDNVLFSRVLKVDDVFYIPNKEALFLTTGNAGGLEIYIEKKFAGVAGKVGEVLKSYKLTLEGLVAP